MNNGIIYDYSVTWNEIKALIEEKLREEGINGDDKTEMGRIARASEQAWKTFCHEKDKEYGLTW